MRRGQVIFDVRDSLMRARGLALRQAEVYTAELEDGELDAIHRAVGQPDHGPVLAKICDEIADRLAAASKTKPQGRRAAPAAQDTQRTTQ